ncbi:MAG: RNA-binding protein [Thermoproteota archaeon]|nr:MAG: RNA-binding protein [Candidatus Korarchaeota archaeon]
MAQASAEETRYASGDLKCTSCGRKVDYVKGVVTFTCPSCGEAEIVRCPTCRKQANPYTCPNCGFTGP